MTKTKAQIRKETPIFQGVLKYFPNAMGAIARVSRQGNIQHDTGDPNKELIWDKNKSNDHEDSLVRHLIDHSVNPMDDDGHLHLSKVAWRALAALEIYLTSASKFVEDFEKDEIYQNDVGDLNEDIDTYKDAKKALGDNDELGF